MRFRIVMEIVEEHGEIPADLIVKGYRFSQYGAVAFILHGIDARAVNRILDPVVPSMSLAIPGVTYIDIKKIDEVRDAIYSARTVVAKSSVFAELVNHISWFGAPKDLLSRYTRGRHSLRPTILLRHNYPHIAYPKRSTASTP